MERRSFIAGVLGLAGTAIAGTAQAHHHHHRHRAAHVRKAKTHMVAVADKPAVAATSDPQAAVRELLTTAVTAATARATKPGGYWDDVATRIPLPKALADARKALAASGQAVLLDDVQLRMNRAAEQAAPGAAALLNSAIADLSVHDAHAILRGGSAAGTDYLRRASATSLTAGFTPVIENALMSTGSVAYLDRAARHDNLQNIVGSDPRTYLGAYSAGPALNGLFRDIAAEEAAIRRDPTRHSDTLKTALA